ncbi:MAG: molecular chaperone DnaK [Armatimonadota bacterium]|nr:MAG: molecular chaperone DnaK [Armatimonadota bacterium]
MADIIGIDLGTTNSAVAAMHAGEPVIIPTAEGGRLCPSVVAFTKSGERLVGQVAKRQAVANAARTILSVKRHMGTDWHVEIDGRSFTAPEISAAILEKLRADAEAFLAAPVRQAVITVPAYFSDAQRQATRDAVRIAGLDVVRIINEPTAAALAYGLDKQNVHTVLVWDLGGGTFDVSVLELGEGIFEVKATSGDTHLGGDDWDQRIVDWLADECTSEQAVELRDDANALQRLKEAAERAKIELSSTLTTRISLPFIGARGDTPIHLERELTRAHLEHMTSDLLARVIEPTRMAMSDAGIGKQDLESIILVGGLTRMPAVVHLVREFFGREPHQEINPDEVVAVGAAIQAAILAGQISEVVLLDVTPLSLGIETMGGLFTGLISRNTTIPVRKTETFTTGTDNQAAVDIHVLQGERDMAEDNISLGRFQLAGIRPAPKGIPRIKVTFDIDVNGIVQVSARDVATGHEREVQVTPSSGLTPERVDELIEEAEKNRDRDRRRRQAAELHLRIDDLLAGADRALADALERLPSASTQPLVEAMDKAKQAQATPALVLLRDAAEALERTTYEVTEALYRYNAAEQAARAAGVSVADAGQGLPAPESEEPSATSQTPPEDE